MIFVFIAKDLRRNKKAANYIWATASDSSDQIVCIHTCQGIEFDYIGVIIGPDLFCEDGGIQTRYMARSKDDNTLRRLFSHDPDGEEKEKAKMIIRNTYRVLLIRGLKGCRIYCANKDDSLNQAMTEHIKSRLKKQNKKRGF